MERSILYNERSKKMYNDKIIEDKNKLHPFWQRFIDEEWPDIRQIISGIKINEKIAKLSIKYDYKIQKVIESIIDYVEEEMMRYEKIAYVSWVKFKKEYLSNVEDLSEVLELDKRHIIRACRGAYKRVIKARDVGMSFEEFKEKYLAKIRYLAELFDLDEWKERSSAIGLRTNEDKNEAYDDWRFIDCVMTYIRCCEEKEEKKRALWKLYENDGVQDIFDEIYRIWSVEKYDYLSKHWPFTRRKVLDSPRRFDAGQGEIVDRLCISGSSAGPHVYYLLGEDFAEARYPIEIKIKHNSGMTSEEVAGALLHAARSYEYKFTKGIMEEKEDLGLRIQQLRASRIGLYTANRSVYRDFEFGLCDRDIAMKLVGWLDPEVSLDTGIGEMLKRGWPELYESVLEGNMTAFEALQKTDRMYDSDEMLLHELEQL